VSLQTVSPVDPKTALIRDDFAANAADLPGADLGWLNTRRKAAIAAFAQSGMPTRRVEEWKYTDIAAALEEGLEPLTPFRAVPGAITSTGAYAPEGATQILIVDGFLHWIGGVELSDAIVVVDLAQLSVRTPEWVEKNLGLHAATEDQLLGAASLGLMRGGVAIRVRAGAEGLPPLHLNFVNLARGRSVMNHTRVLIILDEGASLKLVETHSGNGEDQHLSNIGMELVLAKNADLSHVRFQEESGKTVHVTSVGAELARDARYNALVANFGAKLSRIDMNVKLAAPGATASVHSVTALTDSAHADVTTVMDHAAPHTVSKQLFKSVLGGRARSVSQGKVTVREGAVKSDSHQLFKALLLGERAEADAKPELEIYADDVVCGHGTAIGSLDANALFYLRSRGIPEAEAKSMLVRAFLGEAIDGLADEEIRDALWQRIDSVLEKISREAA
jgi:Fe-S cluster assembly protein SufD